MYKRIKKPRGGGDLLYPGVYGDLREAGGLYPAAAGETGGL